MIAGLRMTMWLLLLFVDQAWLTNNDLSIRGYTSLPLQIHPES